MISGEHPTFGTLLKRYRVTAGLSQEALAERAGISARGISDLERGLKQTPRRDTVEMLAAALGLAADERAAWEATVARRRGAQGGLSGAPASQSAAHASDFAPLPIPLTPLLGRVQEVAALTGLLHRDEVRLLTLVGPGGVGKTRLAVAVGAAALGDYPAGVWLVELASVADPTLVPRSVAGALGLREEPHRSHLATLVDGLADRHLLLVLDNCEHLLAACANLVSGLLRACAALRVLATSRAGLGVRGEQLYRVPPLRVPSPHALPPLVHLGGYGAVSLFVTRAQARRRDFALSADTAPAVVEICRRLDGLPLAIELAAARIGSMAVAEIARRLEGSFGLLTGGPRDVAARQQTLRATLDWSWALLDTAEQALLGHLSVFAGGWTLDAAEAVCGGAGAEVLELLAGLVDVSLVELEESGGQARYRLLETVRQYAGERLDAEPVSVRATVHRRHLNWCLALAEDADSRLFGPEQQLWGRRLEAEHDNLRAALTWSVQGAQQPDAGLRLASALGMFWAMRGHLAEGRRWLEGALATAPRSAALRPTRATALQRAGYLAYRQGDYEQAGAFYDQSTALAQELGDQRSLAWALNGLVGHATNSAGKRGI